MTQPDSLLHGLGWGPTFDDHFKRLGRRDWIAARVAAEHRAELVILHERGESRAVISGRLRHEAASPLDWPAVGDWVAAELGDGAGSRATIRALLPRRSCFARQAAGDRAVEQVVAANVDTVFLMCGLDEDFNLRRLERALTLAWNSGATPVVILNKCDLCEGRIDGYVDELTAVAIGVQIHAISAAADDGVDELRAYLAPGKTIACIGSSGVGKSTLVNRLLGAERQKTAAVRESDGRGKHTTTARELLMAPDGGVVIDTPGMRELQMLGSHDSLDAAFDDIDALAANCRFNDCRHMGEPGCAVTDAINRGRLDVARLESYHKLEREMNRMTRAQSRRFGRLCRDAQKSKERYRTGLDDW